MRQGSIMSPAHLILANFGHDRLPADIWFDLVEPKVHAIEPLLHPTKLEFAELSSDRLIEWVGWDARDLDNGLRVVDRDEHHIEVIDSESNALQRDNLNLEDEAGHVPSWRSYQHEVETKLSTRR